MTEGPERDEQQALLQLYVEVLDKEPDAHVRRDCADRLLALHLDAPLGVTILERVAAIASDKGDTDVHKRVLELLTHDDDMTVKTRALERLGNLFADLGDRRAAAQSWRPAAQLREETPNASDDARRLYERVLDTLPDDVQAAERLVNIYADANEWEKIPEVLGVVVRGELDRGAALVLRLEERAYKAGKLDEFTAMVDEAAALSQPLSTTTRRLRRAKARALTENPARHAEASALYRELLETFGREDDPREYQSFIEARPNPREHMWERRWLYQWRARHDDRPADALVEWARDEEQFGERENAPSIYDRALLAAPEAERPAIALQLIALYERLSRLDEAVVRLAPILAMTPPIVAAHEVARRLLGDAKSGGGVAEHLERIARAVDDVTAARLFEVLIAARDETASMSVARRLWYRAALNLAQKTPVLDLPTILAGAREMPDETGLWDAAERQASELGQLDVVVAAYSEVLRGSNVDAALAEALGSRMIALEGECAVDDASIFVDALLEVLKHAPCARWAIDRVKLALGAQGRWDALFDLYDRATAAAKDQDERIELLREAATAARDLAGNVGKAIAYFEAIRALRPVDAATASGLERLYEREDRKPDLIALLESRAAHADAAERYALQRRIAALWFELGKVKEASAALESIIEDGTVPSDLADILERLVRHRPQLNDASADSAADVNAAALAGTQSRASARCVRALVGIRVLAAQGSVGVFARALTAIEADVAGSATLSRVAYRSVLVRAIAASKHAPTDADFDDALQGASRAIDALRALFMRVGDARGASLLLARAARLAFPRARQRALLQDAAFLGSERAEDRDRAIRLFTEIFADQGADAVAPNVKDRFVELLVAAGADCERQEAPERALALYEQGAALGSEASFDALARLHAKQAAWTTAIPALEWLCTHGSAESRARHTLRLAEALVALGQSDRARTSLEEVLGSRPAADIAHEARARLIDIYRQERSWRALADMLCAHGDLSEDADARATLFSEAATVKHDELREPVEAAWLLDLALTSAPQDLSLRPKLAAMLEEVGDWDRVVEVLTEQTERYGDRRSKERALIHQRLANAILRVKNRRASDALEHLQTAAKMYPTHEPILFDLARVALAADDLDLAEKTYRALLLAIRNAKDAIPAFSLTAIFLDLGAIAIRKNDPRRAADLFESGLEAALEKAEDGHPFEQALLGMGRHDLVARAVEARVLRTSDVNARAAALCELAQLWSEHLAREPELGGRIRRLAEAIAVALEAQESQGEGAWTSLWSVHTALGDEPAMLAMVRARVNALERIETTDTWSAPTAVGDNAWLLEAIALALKLDDHDLASKIYNALIRTDPRAQDIWTKNPKAAFDLGRALEHAGRKPDAVRLYESLLDVRPIDRDTVRAIATRLEELGGPRLADSIELWMDLDMDAGVTLAPRLVALREGQGDQVQIVRALELGWAADPTNETFLQRLVDLYRVTDSHEEIIRLLDGAIAKRPDDDALLCSRARAKAALGDDDGAAIDVGNIRDVDASEIDIIVEILTTITARAVPPAAVVYALLLVDVLVRAERTEHARLELESVVARFPQQAEALERLASLELAAEEWDRAAQTYGRLVSVLEMGSDADGAMLSRAALALSEACERAGRPDDARAALERAVRAEPDRDDIARRLEEICEAAGDSSRLSDLLVARAERTTSVNERTTLLLRAANLLTDLGRPRDAIAPLADALARNAGKRSALMAGLHLALGKAHLAVDELVEAFETLKLGMAMDARNGELVMLLGLLAIDLGDEKTAERALVAVVTLSSRRDSLVPPGPDAVPSSSRNPSVTMGTSVRSEAEVLADAVMALFHLASMAHASGDATKARRWVGKALQQDPTHEGSVALLRRLDGTELDACAGTR